MPKQVYGWHDPVPKQSALKYVGTDPFQHISERSFLIFDDDDNDANHDADDNDGEDNDQHSDGDEDDDQ